ncbi:MAG: restriction endonuclease subunit S [Ferroplasma sp.]
MDSETTIWNTRFLKDVIELKYGKGLKESEREMGEFPVYGSSGVIDYHKKYLVDGPGIIIGRKGTVGKVNFSKINFWPIDTTYYLELKNHGNWAFFYYFLKTLNFELLNTHSAVPGLNREDVYNLKVKIPDYKEQRAIAKILSDLDSKIELDIRMNKTLESIAQALFKHWFIDFEFPDDNGNPYKSSGGEMVESELGEIPKGWEVNKLANYVDVIKGCSYRSEDLKRSNIALVTLKSINRGGGFNQDGYKEYVGDYDQDQILNEGDIIIAQTDLTQEAEVIGRAAIVNSLGKYSQLIASLDLQIIRPREVFSRNYLYYLLSRETFHNHALSYTNGTTVLHLNKNAVSEYKTVIPSKAIMKKFDICTSTTLQRIGININEKGVLVSIRCSLLPKLMSGKIRVPLEVINDKKNE